VKEPLNVFGLFPIPIAQTANSDANILKTVQIYLYNGPTQGYSSAPWPIQFTAINVEHLWTLRPGSALSAAMS
jgi:hypothetical protein